MILKVLLIFVMTIYSLLIKNQISFISGLLNLNNINNHWVSSLKTLTAYIQMPGVHTQMNYMVHETDFIVLTVNKNILNNTLFITIYVIVKLVEVQSDQISYFTEKC